MTRLARQRDKLHEELLWPPPTTSNSPGSARELRSVQDELDVAEERWLELADQADRRA